jgi:hypothetical protein
MSSTNVPLTTRSFFAAVGLPPFSALLLRLSCLPLDMSDFASFAKKAKEEIQTKQNHREWYLNHLRLNGGLDEKHERALGSVYDSAAADIKDLLILFG